MHLKGIHINKLLAQNILTRKKDELEEILSLYLELLVPFPSIISVTLHRKALGSRWIHFSASML
jgi:hypothetical protein